jgi:hypothetical protein
MGTSLHFSGIRVYQDGASRNSLPLGSGDLRPSRRWFFFLAHLLRSFAQFLGLDNNFPREHILPLFQVPTFEIGVPCKVASKS